MTAGHSPTSEKDATREDEDKTIAMAPKELGANSRVNKMLRANRLDCSAKLPLPSQAPPRVTLALRPSPISARSAAPFTRSSIFTDPLLILYPPCNSSSSFPILPAKLAVCVGHIRTCYPP